MVSTACDLCCRPPFAPGRHRVALRRLRRTQRKGLLEARLHSRNVTRLERGRLRATYMHLIVLVRPQVHELSRVQKIEALLPMYLVELRVHRGAELAEEAEHPEQRVRLPGAGLAQQQQRRVPAATGVLEERLNSRPQLRVA